MNRAYLSSPKSPDFGGVCAEAAKLDEFGYTAIRKQSDDKMFTKRFKIFKMYPVTDDGRLVGCVTTREVQQVPRGEWNQRTVGEIVKPCADENTIQRKADAMQALSNMSRNRASRLMVVENGHLEGILSLKDLLKFISLKVELKEGNGQIGQHPLDREDEVRV